MFDLLELQKTLSDHACPSGSEHLAIGPKLMELARPLVDSVYTDALGNVICHKKGQKGGKRVMYAAHMDAIGFMVDFIDEKGFVWFSNLGGFMPLSLINVRVRFVGSDVRGIIKVKKSADSMAKTMTGVGMGDLYIDIGAKDQKEAEKLLSIGDVAVFETVTRPAAGDRIMTPYADDLAACAILLLAMEQVGDCQNDLYFVFTTQEEVGCRGAHTAAYAIDPHVGYACDVCAVGDTPQSEETKMAVALGKGPAIKIKDSSVICSPQLNEKLRKLAKKEGIEYQDEVMRFGGTDTCEMQATRAGVPATCVSLPARNIHTPSEIYSRGDAQGAARLLAAAAHLKY